MSLSCNSKDNPEICLHCTREVCVHDDVMAEKKIATMNANAKKRKPKLKPSLRPTEEEIERLALFLWQKRAELNVKQFRMAEMLGVSKATYNTWENKQCYPSEKSLQKIHEILGDYL